MQLSIPPEEMSAAERGFGIMKNFRDKIQEFMSGRYGVDDLGRLLFYVSLVLLILSLFVRSSFLSFLIMLLLIYDLFRVMSRNTSARWAENQKFLGLKDRVAGSLRNATRSARDREHVYFRCPNCHQTVRVPRGKGNISIHCPKCHTDFVRRT